MDERACLEELASVKVEYFDYDKSNQIVREFGIVEAIARVALSLI